MTISLDIMLRPGTRFLIGSAGYAWEPNSGTLELLGEEEEAAIGEVRATRLGWVWSVAPGALGEGSSAFHSRDYPSIESAQLALLAHIMEQVALQLS